MFSKKLAVLTALVVLLTSPAFAGKKKESLLDRAQDLVQNVAGVVAVAEGLGNMLGGGDEPKTVPTPDGGTMPNPRNMVLLMGRAIDLRDVDYDVHRWTDNYSGVTYEVVNVRRSQLDARVGSDFHIAFTKKGVWHMIDGRAREEVGKAVDDFLGDRQIDRRTLVELGRRFAAQSLILPEITHHDVSRAIKGSQGRAGFEYITVTLHVNVFMVDLETGTTRQAFKVEASESGFLAEAYWELFVKNAGLQYIQMLPGKVSEKVAKKAAELMASTDRGPIRWIDRDPVERIRGEILNGVAFKVIGDNLVGDLVEVGQRTWTIKFSNIKGIKPRDEFEIWSATKLGLPDAPTGVFVQVDFIDAEKKLVGAHMSKIELNSKPAEQLIEETSEETEVIRPTTASSTTQSWVERLAAAKAGEVFAEVQSGVDPGGGNFTVTPEPRQGESTGRLTAESPDHLVAMVVEKGHFPEDAAKWPTGLVVIAGVAGQPAAAKAVFFGRLGGDEDRYGIWVLPSAVTDFVAGLRDGWVFDAPTTKSESR